MIEKERKFKLKKLPKNLKSINIKQGYLMFDDGKHLRIRIINDEKAFLAYKKNKSKTTRIEYEYEISLTDGIEMLNSCKFRLQKTRYKTTHKDYIVHIDIYPYGKQVVEIEYENKITDLPYYCGEEITGVKEYSNIWMAKNNTENGKNF